MTISQISFHILGIFKGLIAVSRILLRKRYLGALNMCFLFHSVTWKIFSVYKPDKLFCVVALVLRLNPAYGESGFLLSIALSILFEVMLFMNPGKYLKKGYFIRR